MAMLAMFALATTSSAAAAACDVKLLQKLSMHECDGNFGCFNSNNNNSM